MWKNLVKTNRRHIYDNNHLDFPIILLFFFSLYHIPDDVKCCQKSCFSKYFYIYTEKKNKIKHMWLRMGSTLKWQHFSNVQFIGNGHPTDIFRHICMEFYMLYRDSVYVCVCVADDKEYSHLTFMEPLMYI